MTGKRAMKDKRVVKKKSDRGKKKEDEREPVEKKRGGGWGRNKRKWRYAKIINRDMVNVG